MSSTKSNPPFTERLFDINRLVFLVLVGVVAVGLNNAGLPLFGINTVSEAI